MTIPLLVLFACPTSRCNSPIPISNRLVHAVTETPIIPSGFFRFAALASGFGC